MAGALSAFADDIRDVIPCLSVQRRNWTGTAYWASVGRVNSHPDTLRRVLVVHPGEYGLEELPLRGGGNQSEGAPLTEQSFQVSADRGFWACEQAERGGCGDAGHEMYGWAKCGLAG